MRQGGALKPRGDEVAAPLVHITGRVREAFYVDYVGSYADLRYPLEIALVTTFIGLAGIRLFSRELLDK